MSDLQSLPSHAEGGADLIYGPPDGVKKGGVGSSGALLPYLRLTATLEGH